MPKELLELLDSINKQKAIVKNLVDEGKLDEAEEAKKELVNMQRKFDLLKDMAEAAPANTQPVNPIVDMTANDDPVHSFANAARMRFMNLNKEGSNEDGGYTVPEDILTRINKWKEARFALASLVDSESVTTPSGRRTYMKKADHTGFSAVAEAGKIGAVNGPKFEVINYSIKKYAGYLPVTNELLADSDANITNVLIEWLGEENIATRNKLILDQIAKKTATAITGIDDIKKAVNVTLGQAYAGTVSIVTNDDGLNYLDTLKDENGRYLLQPEIDPTKPIQMSLAVGARKIPVVVVPNSVLKTTSSKIPFIIGDLKEYCKIFDRAQMTIMTSNIAAVGSGDTAVNAFEQDLTLFRAIERLDCIVKDSNAIVNATLTVSAGE